MYNVKKIYESAPSKNHVESKGLTLANAIAELDLNERLWKKNGGLVVNREAERLTVEEADGSEVITWQIVEA